MSAKDTQVNIEKCIWVCHNTPTQAGAEACLPLTNTKTKKRPHKTRQHKTKQHKRCWVLVGASAGGFGFLRFSRNFEKDVVIRYFEVSFQVFFLISSMFHANFSIKINAPNKKTGPKRQRDLYMLWEGGSVRSLIVDAKRYEQRVSLV